MSTEPKDAPWEERLRWYRDVYLLSDHWRETREAALERAGRKCQLCGYEGRLQVHHRSYERLGAELPTDLTVLCQDCHDTHHEDRKRRRDAREPDAVEDRRRAAGEARMQLVLVMLAAGGGRTHKQFVQLTGWRGQRLGHTLGGLRRRELIEQRGSRENGVYELTAEGARVARDLLYNPEPLFWRIPPDPTRDRARSDQRSDYRNIGALESAHQELWPD